MPSHAFTHPILTNLDRPLTPTSPEFSPMDDGVVIKDEAHLTDDEWVGLEDLNLPKTTTRERDQASMSFTVCYDDDCWIHASEKRDRDYYPRMHHRIPPPTSPLSSASEMSWNPDDHDKDKQTLQGRSEKKEGGKKLRKTVQSEEHTSELQSLRHLV